MLKAAFVTDAPRIAGSEHWLKQILPLLIPYGIQPTLLVPNRPSLLSLAHDLSEKGIEVIPYRRFTDAVFHQTFDLWVVQAWKGWTYYTLLPRLSRPRIALIHDQLEYHYPMGLKRLYQVLYMLEKALPLHKADLLITVSKWGAKHLKKLGLRNVVGAPNGVDVNRFYPAKEGERRELRSRFNFHRFTVLVPGRFAMEKNQITSVLVAKEVPEIDFVFVGDDDSSIGWAARTIAKIYNLTNIRFMGPRSDMPELYRASDAVLQPTLAENQSLVTLEAMASGLPVITTPIPAQAELIQDRVEGLLVPPQPLRLAKALRCLFHHPTLAQRLGQAARAKILSAHTLDRSALCLSAALKGEERACASTV
ncbi:MAG: lipopolysaccharide biosynthesis protein [Thermus sp.]